VIDRWPKEQVALPARDMHGEAAPAACVVELAAMPGFSSPFSWRLIAQLSNGYELHDIDLLARQPATARAGSAGLSRLSVRYPNQWTQAVLHAARAPVAQTFLGFSRFPAARSFIDDTGTATVRWSDMRFVTSPLGDRRPTSSNLFSVVVRLDPNGRIIEQKFGPR